MKIPLNMGQNNDGKPNRPKVSETEILAAKGGDWTAKNSMARTFTPLISSLAQKRSNDVNAINNYIEAGKEGLYIAAKKYKTTVTPARFQIFALDYIQSAMDRVDGKGGFFSKIFGK